MKLALSKDLDGRKSIVEEIHNRFYTMKTYGKEPETLTAITNILLRDLSDFSTDKIMKAFQTHAQRNQEFPTTADLVGLIKRNGKPPLKESDIIAIRKKDGEFRNSAEWAMLREWEAQQTEQWDNPSPIKQAETVTEMLRLRQQVKELKQENARAWAKVSEKNNKPKEGGGSDKITATLEYLKSMNAPQSDIDAFLNGLN